MDSPNSVELPLQRTVVTICGLLADDRERRAALQHDEFSLRVELIACLLSSQVSSTSSELALTRLIRKGLLDDSRWGHVDAEFEVDLVSALRGDPDAAEGSYRFPNSKSRQVSDLRNCLLHAPLRARLSVSTDVYRVRELLVRDLPGIGPKQASMFLRNTGVSYQLAVLDGHVMRFMHNIGLISNSRLPLSTISQYSQAEAVATQYAATLGYPVGYLDWAIWITMQAVKELRA